MKSLLMIGAAAIGTAVVATPALSDTKPMSGVELTAEQRDAIIAEKLSEMPESTETAIYDGPDSFTPSQPPPEEYNGVGGPDEDMTYSGPMDQFEPIARDYPFCSDKVRDNCQQRIDPGY